MASSISSVHQPIPYPSIPIVPDNLSVIFERYLGNMDSNPLPCSCRRWHKKESDHDDLQRFVGRCQLERFSPFDLASCFPLYQSLFEGLGLHTNLREKIRNMPAPTADLKMQKAEALFALGENRKAYRLFKQLAKEASRKTTRDFPKSHFESLARHLMNLHGRIPALNLLQRCFSPLDQLRAFSSIRVGDPKEAQLTYELLVELCEEIGGIDRFKDVQQIQEAMRESVRILAEQFIIACISSDDFKKAAELAAVLDPTVDSTTFLRLGLAAIEKDELSIAEMCLQKLKNGNPSQAAELEWSLLWKTSDPSSIPINSISNLALPSKIRHLLELISAGIKVDESKEEFVRLVHTLSETETGKKIGFFIRFGHILAKNKTPNPFALAKNEAQILNERGDSFAFSAFKLIENAEREHDPVAADAILNALLRSTSLPGIRAPILAGLHRFDEALDTLAKTQDPDLTVLISVLRIITMYTEAQEKRMKESDESA